MANHKLYHHTLSLLQNYRTIVWMLKAFPTEIESELERPLADLDVLLAMADSTSGLQNRRIQNKMNSIEKSRLLLDRINDAVTVLKQKPGDGGLMYRLIYETFITQEKSTHMELLERLDMSTRHYYRIRQKAIRIISIRLWGSPSAEVDTLIDVTGILNSG